jgi:hypothetical protein
MKETRNTLHCVFTPDLRYHRSFPNSLSRPRSPRVPGRREVDHIATQLSLFATLISTTGAQAPAKLRPLILPSIASWRSTPPMWSSALPPGLGRLRLGHVREREADPRPHALAVGELDQELVTGSR